MSLPTKFSAELEYMHIQTEQTGKQDSSQEIPNKARPMLPFVQCCVPAGGSSRR